MSNISFIDYDFDLDLNYNLDLDYNLDYNLDYDLDYDIDYDLDYNLDSSNFERSHFFARTCAIRMAPSFLPNFSAISSKE